MSERSAEHATFAVERTYDATPARVFAAFSDAGAKQQWFSGPDGWTQFEYALDFRVGGREISRVGTAGEPTWTYEAFYRDIVPNARIVHSYTMDRDAVRVSVSVATVEFEAVGAGTRVRITEDGVFLDGQDKPEYREHGTRELLNSLGTTLHDTPAAARP